MQLEQERALRRAAEARAAAAAASAAEALEQQRSRPGGGMSGGPGAAEGEGGAGGEDGRDALLQEQAKQLLRMQRELAGLAEQLSASQQRVVDLEAAAAAGATAGGSPGHARPGTADSVRQSSGASGEASLKGGMAAGNGSSGLVAPPLSGAAALRLKQLEEENAALMRRLQAAEADARDAIGRAAAEAGREAGRLRAALAERDAEVASLAAELVVVRAAVEAGAGRCLACAYMCAHAHVCICARVRACVCMPVWWGGAGVHRVRGAAGVRVLCVGLRSCDGVLMPHVWLME